MTIKFQYSTENERSNILAENLSKGLFLIEEQNLFEGNFLIFSDAQVVEPTVKLSPIEQHVSDLQDQIDLLKHAADELILNKGV